ncbi:hypothetical protein EJ02DRAFT_211482 [Clathrospora elynae]|uniref:Uncharacterized protein n=1 Tax=Clathrospora elynae TaxID=706981 RepID=A0A6A5SMP5_9PLEO|nr:hypothetical protein EJ02DRAFT_211482 [Clathrospora elynae]
MWKPDKPRATFMKQSIDDFGYDVGATLFDKFDGIMERMDGRRLTVKLEVKISCEALQRAVARPLYFNESDPPETPSMAGHRTKQQLKDGRAEIRAEQKAQERMETATLIKTQADHTAEIVNSWRCHKGDNCRNGGGICYVPLGSMIHYQVRPNNLDSWAYKIVTGENNVSVRLPPAMLVEAWRLRGNKLRVNPNNRRRIDDDSDDDGIKGAERKAAKARARMRLQRLEDEEEEMEEQRRQRKLQRLQGPAQLNQPMPPYSWLPPHGYPHLYPPFQPGYPTPSAPAPAAPAPAAPAPAAPAPAAAPQQALPSPTKSIPPLSSSPVNGSGVEDTRKEMKAFFSWLISEQDDEDAADYKHTAEVALDQRWTIEDLRHMSNPQDALYRVAVDNFRLKDGIVRHFRKDLHRFKATYRTAKSIEVMAARGVPSL